MIFCLKNSASVVFSAVVTAVWTAAGSAVARLHGKRVMSAIWSLSVAARVMKSQIRAMMPVRTAVAQTESTDTSGRYLLAKSQWQADAQHRLGITLEALRQETDSNVLSGRATAPYRSNSVIGLTAEDETQRDKSHSNTAGNLPVCAGCSRRTTASVFRNPRHVS
jgi:hypothetical protein